MTGKQWLRGPTKLYPTYPHVGVYDLCKEGLDVELALPVGQEASQAKEWLAFRDELVDDAAEAEDVHRRQQLAIETADVAVDAVEGVRVVEALRGNTARAAARRIEEVRERRRIVHREVSRFETRKIGEKHPVPAGEQDVVNLDVAMAHLAGVAPVQRLEAEDTRRPTAW